MEDKFPDVTQEQIDTALSEDKLRGMKYMTNVDAWCKYCANRELCTAYYCNATE